MSRLLEYCAVSDVGCVRKNNEDMACVAGQMLRDGKWSGTVVSESLWVAFAVADGMGGYEGGEIASEIVCRSFVSFMNTMQGDCSGIVVSSLKQWAVETNRLVIDTATLKKELAEMGTTFTGLVFYDNRIWLLNIGDSRCYRLRNGVLKQLSTDHSERERTGDSDVPSNLIYNFMGNHPDDFISDISELTAISGDIYLLCSDGLSDLVGEEEIEALATRPQELVDRAKAAGGRDNITVVSVRFSDY